MFKLSNPTINKKGILIFKHLEQGLINNLERTNSLDLIKKKYIIGLYFGGSTSFDINSDLIDFVVAKKNVILNEGEIKKPILRYSGNSFISANIKKYRVAKKSKDFVGVFNRSRLKRPEDFIEISRELHKANPNYKIHLITYGDKSNNLKFLKHGYSHPNFVHQDFVTNNKHLFPMDEDDLYKFIASSKAFIHTSRTEGASRIVVESCLLHVPVFYNKDIKGGTFTDELKKANVIYEYSSFSDVVEINNNSLKPINSLELDKNFIEEYSIKSFCNEIENLKLNTNTNTEYNFIHNISFSKLLPSHGNIICSRLTNLKDDQFTFTKRLLKHLQEEDKADYSSQKFKLSIIYYIENYKIIKLKIKKKIWEILN
jgi:glycosyltransferase involved in cell wall biosynthesis